MSAGIPASASNAGHSTRTQSPAPSFRSAQNTLPETTSFYQQSIEASRTSLNERRFQSVNELHREGSISRSSRRSDNTPLPIDDEIAQGLGEEVNGAGNGDIDGDASYEGFLPARDKSHTHSILPSSAFFVPKRPPQSHTPQTALSPTSAAFVRPLTPSSERLNADHAPQRGDPVPLDHSGRARTGGAVRDRTSSVDLESAFAKGSGSSSEGHAGLLGNPGLGTGRLDQSAIHAYRQGSLREKASHDPLLRHSDQVGSKSSRGQDSMWNQSFTKRPSVKVAANGGQHSLKESDSLHLVRQVRKERRYKSHQGANRFFLSGLVMTSDDNPLPFLGSLFIMFALPILWLIFTAPYIWHHVSPAVVIIFAYLFAIAGTSMCVTAWRDPGVIPRDLDPDPPCTAGEDGITLGVADPLAVPLPRIVRIRNGTDLKVKWCETCGTYRPPRSSHCRVCDNCVENIDHHCTFLNTCIGKRNYFTFFAFLFASILDCFLAIAFCVVHLYFLTRPTDQALPGGGFGSGKTAAEAFRTAPLSAVIFLLALGVVGPVLTLFSYHIRLICMNRTTVEQIRISTTKTYGEKPSYDDGRSADGDSISRPRSCLKLGIPGRDPNPFAYRTIFRNIRVALLRPMTAHSWIDRYHYEQPDTRNINPAFTVRP